MAQINGIDKDELEKQRKEKAIKQRKELEKLRAKPSGSVEKEHQHKEDVLSVYNNLSDEEKAIFHSELQKKKLRDSYINYLKYIYPDFKVTRFHSMLANILQSAVEKAEHGQIVKIALSTPPQHGKLLENNTPVLTTKGWKKHGDLEIGDYVFNQYGESVKVKHIFQKDIANCKVTFTNGEEILCHENHEWVVYDRFAQKEVVRETKFIEKCVDENNLVGRGHRYRFQLPNREPIKGKNKQLFVNPYVLGVWLGDGTNTKPYICACEEDIITLEECAKIYSDNKTYIHKTTGVITKSFKCLNKDLQKYGMCFYNKKCEKHIPQEYMTASIEQRLELLAGLLDTDGHLERKCHRYVFVTADKELKTTFEELISTFGWRTTTYEAKPTISTSGIIGRKVYWQIAFNPTMFIPCRIPRKQLLTYSKQRKISICKVERIKPKEGNCIEVEGGVYCAGKTMLPTHNSKTATETLPSWFLGRNPNLRCIVTGYNADIAEKFGDRNRQIVKQYGKDIFGISISESQDNKTLWNIDKKEGGMLSAGILGGITGNQGALIIVDDPYKNGNEANNPELRQKIWDTFVDSIMTRMRASGCVIIVIHTRWHEDDLIGRLKNLGDWIIVNMPCVWEKGEDRLLHRKIGETLCPELGFNAQWAEGMKKMLGQKKWNALYQGDPFIEGGNIIQRKDIKFYDRETQPANFEEIVLSCDLTFGGENSNNDPYCMSLWGRNGGNHYLLKVYDKRANFVDTLKTLRIICSENPQLKKKIIEKKANGQATIDMLGKEISGFVPYDPKNTSKEDRLRSVSAYFEGGNIYFPCEEIMPDIEKYISELLKFPSGAHDDFVDTTSQYLLNYEYRYGGKIDTDNRFGLLARAIRGF